MARLVGFIGTARGRSGNFVYAKGRNGVTIQRAYQPQVKNPRTARQVASRERFAYVSGLAGLFAPALAIANTWRGDFVSKAVRDYDTLSQNANNPDIRIAWASFGRFLAQGSLPDLEPTRISAGEGGTLTASGAVPVDMDLYLSAGDRLGVVAVFYAPGSRVVRIMQTVAENHTYSATITPPEEWIGIDVHCWVFAKLIPASLNYIPTTTEPWKYPAPTSDAIYSGSRALD